MGHQLGIIVIIDPAHHCSFLQTHHSWANSLWTLYCFIRYFGLPFLPFGSLAVHHTSYRASRSTCCACRGTWHEGSASDGRRWGPRRGVVGCGCSWCRQRQVGQSTHLVLRHSRYYRHCARKNVTSFGVLFHKQSQVHNLQWTAAKQQK